MKKNNLYILFSISICFNSCGYGQKKEQLANTVVTKDKAGLNFMSFVHEIIVRDKDTTGLLKAECSYKKLGNNLGNFNIYILHKDGGTNWYKSVQKKYRDIDTFDKKTNYGYMKAAKRLMNEDSTQLSNFNKWVFFTDKKYLREYEEAAESGTHKYYDINESSEMYTVTLYQQLAGEKKWIELKKTDFYLKEKDVQRNETDPNWEEIFIKRKVKESNQIPNKK